MLLRCICWISKQ